MIDVTDTWWIAIVIAAVSGLLGGLIYELLLARFSDAGMIERAASVEPEGSNRRYFDLGFIASMLIGAVAAVGFLYFMPPTEIVNESSEVVRREYDAFRLIPAALIVGSAGGAFLTSMQERLKRVAAETTNSNARAILEAETPSAPGGLIPAGPGGGSPTAGSVVSQDTVNSAIRVLRSSS